MPKTQNEITPEKRLEVDKAFKSSKAIVNSERERSSSQRGIDEKVEFTMYDLRGAWGARESKELMLRQINKKLTQAILSERKRLLEEVNKWQEEVQQETGAFKYDFVFEGMTNIINNK